MCGISGRVNYRTGAPVDAAVLEGMCDRLRHRGPDGFGVWSDAAVGFGHRRLAVIDTSNAGRQPLQTPDGRFTITFNGEIYNFQDLRCELEAQGARFTTRTDTEVILHAYARDGAACLKRLRGMFAFAVWDAREQTLFAARDRAGQKPFYYREDADGLSFASEPKAFLAEPSFVPDVDAAAVWQYLSFQYVPAPGSAFRGVRQLPPGHFLRVERGRVTIDRYWTLRYDPKSTISEAEAVERMRADLAEATRMMLVSDVPIGAFLSGGLDSSLVVALMAEAAGGRVETFSIGFDDASYDETAYARQVAARFSTSHHEAIVRPDALAILPKLLWHYNEPFADSSAIPTLYLSEMTRRHVTVALNGDAGDENFAGYERYAAYLIAARMERVPRLARRMLAAGAAWPPPGKARTLRSRAQRFLAAAADPGSRRYARWNFHFTDEEKRAICTPEFLARAGGEDAAARYDALFADLPKTAAPIDVLLHADVESYLPDDLLVKVDRATMAYGLEGRSPLLDHVVMERAACLPADLKLRGTTKKYLLKRIARGLVPDEVIDRPKMGFGVPLADWLRGPLRDLAHDVLLGTRMRQRGYFRMDAIERLVSGHDAGRLNAQYQLWNLLVLELWHQMFIDDGGRSAHEPASLAAS
jgi:asparagine synthase (glutamine-hydrolysing)